MLMHEQQDLRSQTLALSWKGQCCCLFEQLSLFQRLRVKEGFKLISLQLIMWCLAFY